MVKFKTKMAKNKKSNPLLRFMFNIFKHPSEILLPYYDVDSSNVSFSLSSMAMNDVVALIILRIFKILFSL